MSKTSEILFEYLRDVLYDPSKATLDVDELDDDFVMLGKGLMYFAHCFSQYNDLATALSKGDLSVSLPPPENELSAPLKSLHASLRHLTWQSQQVAKGDYKQRVDFMGDFSDAFNKMIEQLSERQRRLENEIEIGHNKTIALEQSNELLSNITQNIPQQIIVVDRKTHDILFMNESARSEAVRDKGYMGKLLALVARHSEPHGWLNHEIHFPSTNGHDERYLSVCSYFLEWKKANAEAFVITDISVEKSQIKELENYAYRDTMTLLHNRFSGMITLNKWMDSKRQFSLIFVDLDRLKHINDIYGHNEGDHYIITVSKNLKAFSSDCVACRIGGDEFMVLAPKIGYDEAYSRMEEINQWLKNDSALKGQAYVYSLSFGIVYVDKDNNLSSSDVLSLADARMYELKRIRRMTRTSP